METVAFDGSQPRGELGHFTYAVADDTWEWSEGMYAIHGYRPHEVVATTEVLLEHKHPDDRARAFEVLQNVIRDGGAFSCYHRVVDTQHAVRSVLSLGRGLRDEGGRVERVEGYFVDLTDARRSETEAEVQLALARAAEHRAVIEQAKGMLMLATGCDADRAFDRLRHCSSHANLKLHVVAQHVVDSVGPDRHDADTVHAVLDRLVGGSQDAARR